MLGYLSNVMAAMFCCMTRIKFLSEKMDLQHIEMTRDI